MKMNDMTDFKALIKSAEFYKDKEQKVHITLKSGDWLNGFIISINYDFEDRIVIMEERFGEMMVLLERIKPDGILPFTLDKNKRGKDEKTI
jgi:hypothetical protein